MLGGCRRAAGGGSREVVLGQLTSAVELDPHLHDEESTHSALSHFYERLVAFGPELELRPELAESWKNPSDTEWRFTLREGVLFHDGTPLEAEDVVASLLRARSLPGSKVVHYVQDVVRVTAVSRQVVEVVTSAPSPLLLNRLAFVAIVPRAAVRGPIRHPVGTGPYRFVSGTPGGVLEGAAFDGYRGGPPAYGRVRIVPLPDARARARAVEDGTADVVSRFPFEFAASARTRPGVRLVSRLGLGVSFLGFSLRPGRPWADPRVREAFALAIDRSRIVDPVEAGFTIPAEQFVPSAVFGHAPPARPWRHDTALARVLLAKAGHPAGLDATIVLAEPQAGLGARLAELLAEAGMRVRLETLPWEEYYARWSRHELDLFVFAYTAGTGDASDLLDSVFHSPTASRGTQNAPGYANPAFDALVDEAGRLLDPLRRRDLMVAALGRLREDLPAIPLVVRSHLYAVSERVEWAPRADRRVRAQDMKPRR